jgi:hypothetical protein
MAERVVDLLEAVEVEEQERAGAAVKRRLGRLALDQGQDPAPVEQPGQRVAVSEIAQLLECLFVLAPGRDVRQEHEEPARLSVDDGDAMEARGDACPQYGSPG